MDLRQLRMLLLQMVRFFTDKYAGNLANDTYTNNNTGNMITNNISKEVVKIYCVIQNGVSTDRSWECSFETFKIVNGVYPKVPGDDPIKTM